MNDIDQIIDQVSDYLRYKAECGERVVEVEREALVALRAGVGAAVAAPTHLKSQISNLTESNSVPPSTLPPLNTSTPRPPDLPTSRPPDLPTSRPPDLQTLAAIAAECEACRACGLVDGRNKVVPGQGCADSPPIMFIGEAPGADEDEQGLAFVGRAGQLLTKMIAAMGYTRDEVFIANICKCRPPGNRTPTPQEMAACIPFLKRQVAIVRPRFIVALGNTAILGLLGETGILRIHGKWRQFEGIPLMPTMHPAYLLRNPSAKRACWEDLKLVMAKLKG